MCAITTDLMQTQITTIQLSSINPDIKEICKISHYFLLFLENGYFIKMLLVLLCNGFIIFK